MMTNLTNSLRKTKLIKTADKLRFYYLYFKTRHIRKEFRQHHPGVVLPPPFYMYETFGLDVGEFYTKSIESAAWLSSHFLRYKQGEDLKILDWGCGPGRIIRHLPSFFEESCEFYGSDYNKKYVKWCSRNITGVSFAANQLQPPLVYPSGMFDIAYGISIFTHLSEEMHYAWFEELMRVLRPEGILFVTLHGKAFKTKMTEEEKARFNKGELVEKANTKEGHRTFVAFQPDAFVKKLVGQNEIFEHIPGEVKNNKPQQDVWIIRKKETD